MTTDIKKLLTTALVVLAVMAIVNRVPQLKSLVG